MQKMCLLCQLAASIDIEKGEDHQYQGRLIHLLQSAVGSGSYDQYKKYSAGIHNLPPINIRDLLEFKKSKKEISVDEVEPLEEILKRFGSGVCPTGLYQPKHMKLWRWA